jgi:glycine/D-amino acid oxidase-like deaminating enzyme
VQVTLPLLRAASPRVFVAGGHGTRDVALGPATGQLRARSVLEGEAPRSSGPSTRCAGRPPSYAHPKELLRAAPPRP